jgi:hypothetical protein
MTRLDGTRIVVAPACGRTVSIVDVATGTVTASVQLPEGAHEALVTKLDGGAAVAAGGRRPAAGVASHRRHAGARRADHRHGVPSSSSPLPTISVS